MKSNPHPLKSGVWRLASFGAALICCGCADLQWSKDGAPPTAMEDDLAECKSQARINAGPDARFVRPDVSRIVGVDAAGRPVAGTAGRLDSDRFLLEHDLTRDCMTRKGYELTPRGSR